MNARSRHQAMRRIHSILFVALLGGLGSVPGFAQTNYVVNGQFAQGFNCWQGLGEGASIQPPPPATPSFARLTVTESHPTESWRVQLRQVASLPPQPECPEPALSQLEDAVVYELSFDAKSTLPTALMTIELSQRLGLQSDPTGPWFVRVDMPIQGQGVWSRYTVTLRTPEDLASRRSTYPNTWLQLEVGKNPVCTLVDIDNVELKRAPELIFDNGIPLTVASFEPSTPYASWYGGSLEPSPGRSTRSLRLSTVTADGAAFASTPIDLKVLDAPWDLVMEVYVTAPQNIGRMYFAARSPLPPNDTLENVLFQTFAGLQPGWNTITLPMEDFVRYWFACQANWASTFEIGIKLESNGNGAADVWIDDLTLQPSSGAPDTRRTPAIFEVYVEVPTDAAGRTNPRPTVVCEVSETASLSLECGATPATYAPVSVNDTTDPANPKLHRLAFVNTVPAGVRRHCRLTATEAGGSSRSGDFTFTTLPATRPVPAPPPNAPDYLVGAQSAEHPEDQTIALGSGFNTVHAFLEGGCGCPPTDRWGTLANAYLSSAVSKGTKALLTAFCLPAQLSDPAYAACELGEAHVQDRVVRLSSMAGYSALLGYYLFDEPELVPVAVQLANDFKGVVDDTDTNNPQPPVIIGSCSLGWPCGNLYSQQGLNYPYKDALDVAIMDHYPIPFGHPEDVAGSVANASALNALGKPVQFTFQAYQAELDRRWPGSTPGPTRYPSRTEMRAMAWLAIVHGAKGLWAFSQGGVLGSRNVCNPVPLDNRLAGLPGAEWHWTELSEVVREIRDVGPMIASPDPLTLGVTANTATIHVAQRSYLGKHYVIAVNASNATVPATFTSVGPSGALRALDSGTPPAWKAGCMFDDALDPYEVRVYEISSGSDGDGDGVGGVCDNCPTIPNANQYDCNDDGTGDVCSQWCWKLMTSLDGEDGHVSRRGTDTPIPCAIYAPPACPASGSTLAVGDAKTSGQQVTFKGFLSFSFPTEGLPMNAQKTGAILRLVRQSETAQPDTALGSLFVEVESGVFGSGASLAADDFLDTSFSGTLQATVPITVPGYVTLNFTSSELTWINTTPAGRTQMRLRFANANDGDNSADKVFWYSGKTTNLSTQWPQLQVFYTAP